MTNEEIVKHLTYLKEWFVEGSEPYVSVDNAIKTLEQEHFMNKPCVAHQVCHEDKIKMLDKIRAEIEEERSFYRVMDEYDIAKGLRNALGIIDKYRAESEEY